MKEKAAEQLKLTADYMHQFGLIDAIVPEPTGGAHWDYTEAAALLTIPREYDRRTKTDGSLK
jgi:acetyl-CoA carboxylase carboxyl transferase subunit alpha